MHPRMRIMGLFLLLGGMFAIIGWVLGGYFAGGNWILGAAFFLVLAGIFNVISYFFSSKIVLMSYRARILKEDELPWLHDMVSGIAKKAGVPKPKVALVPTKTPNAFATGRNPDNAVVAVTEGIMDVLSRTELEGVLAHEMAHVKDRDILVMTVAATMAGAIAFMARIFWFNALIGGRGGRGGGNALILLVVAITAPMAAMLIQLAISRSREYKADKVGSLTINKPLALASALQKLERANKKKPIDRGNPASSSLFIVNPFRGSGFASIFSTHPPTKERISRLKELAKEI
ncbi:MAG: zinc metalloprotease HtpX [Thermoplasmata archaeon]